MNKLISMIVLGLVVAPACKKKPTATDQPGAGSGSAITTPVDAAVDAAPDSPPAGAPAAGGSILAECNVYAAAMDKYIACDKVTDSARDGAKQLLEAMKSGWANASAMSDAEKAEAQEACKQATTALVKGARAAGCPM